MQKNSYRMMGLLFASAFTAGPVFSQGKPDIGKSEYEASCASCHGVSGKGDGALYKQLVTPPSDLTTLLKRNGGVFPSQRVREAIDGRRSSEIGPHGLREMPVWGRIYRDEDTQPYELHGRVRIDALIDYLARIQVK